MKHFPSNLRGLWVGMALGELFAQKLILPERLASLPLAERTVRNLLPKTYGLTLLATRQLKHLVSEQEAFGLRCARWQDLLLNVVPATFLHPAGPQGLTGTLSLWSESHQQERLTSALVLVQSLEWLQRHSASAAIIPALRLPELPQTQTGLNLETVHQHLIQRKSLQALKQQFEAETPEQSLPLLLYAVISAPYDFRLAVQRAELLFARQPEMILLTAALSGFHLGFAALPLDWRWALKSLRWDVSMPFETGLCTLADLCAGQWAGANGIPEGVFHAAGQLRPR